MIQVRKGDVLAVSAGLIVHGCNCQGVMGSGVAKIVKKMYPLAFDAYKTKCDLEEHEQLLGGAQLVEVDDNLSIANLFTQQFYGKGVRQVSYDAVDVAFESLFLMTDQQIHIPKIGAGLGGGDWEIISTIINQKAGPDRDIFCWEL
jgi:O-acetyl-ADP-ribose deacetylase (regulator of RNase III)